MGQKIRRDSGKLFRRHAHLKRERGEFRIHPAIAPVSLMSADTRFVVNTRSLRTSGGQNLAALCTTAGQNLTAVGSSHSLTETVNLGTMTTAGLIGTLHNTYTSYLFLFHMLDSQMTAATHSNRLSQSCPTIITEKCDLVNLFLLFPEKYCQRKSLPL